MNCIYKTDYFLMHQWEKNRGFLISQPTNCLKMPLESFDKHNQKATSLKSAPTLLEAVVRKIVQV